MESKINNVTMYQAERDYFYGAKAMAMASAALAEGTNDHTIKTVTNPVTYMINGYWYSKAATDNIVMSLCEAQAAGLRCRYLISIDAGGNVTMTKGTEVRAYSYGAATTLSWNVEQKRIEDSASGLGYFVAGDVILVSGFTGSVANNGYFTITNVDPAGAWIQVRESTAVAEAAGATVTITVESPLPDLPINTCPLGALVLITGATAFQVGVDDLTSDIGTGSFSFQNFGMMPSV